MLIELGRTISIENIARQERVGYSVFGMLVFFFQAEDGIRDSP